MAGWFGKYKPYLDPVAGTKLNLLTSILNNIIALSSSIPTTLKKINQKLGECSEFTGGRGQLLDQLEKPANPFVNENIKNLAQALHEYASHQALDMGISSKNLAKVNELARELLATIEALRKDKFRD
ncbi:hypothetical protein HYT55_03165 [Candidatus Woesearchaeota archaeon]|nr:hypothetical protein [Candidatus Woesearchaeota archaeon]